MRVATSKRKTARSIATAVVLLSSIALIYTLGRPEPHIPTPETANERTRSMPSVILWAWERPVDLGFIDAKQVGVAFLARTIILRENNVVVRPRLQPLQVPDNTTMIAVVRVESGRHQGTPALSAAQCQEVADAIADIASLPR